MEVWLLMLCTVELSGGTFKYNRTSYTNYGGTSAVVAEYSVTTHRTRLPLLPQTRVTSEGVWNSPMNQPDPLEKLA